VVLAAVHQDVYALCYTDESLKRDRDLVLAAVAHDDRAFQYADDSLKADRDVVLAAVAKDGKYGMTLQFAGAIATLSWPPPRETSTRFTGPSLALDVTATSSPVRRHKPQARPGRRLGRR